MLLKFQSKYKDKHFFENFLQRCLIAFETTIQKE